MGVHSVSTILSRGPIDTATDRDAAYRDPGDPGRQRDRVHASHACLADAHQAHQEDLDDRDLPPMDRASHCGPGGGTCSTSPRTSR